MQNSTSSRTIEHRCKTVEAPSFSLWGVVTVHLAYTVTQRDESGEAMFVTQRLFTDEQGEDVDFTPFMTPDDLEATAVRPQNVCDDLTRALVHIIALMHPHELLTLTLTVTPPPTQPKRSGSINWDEVAE